MADSEKSLDILIKTRAELGGAIALRDSIEASIGKAKAMGDVEGVKKLTAQLDVVNGSITEATKGSEELAQAEKESGEAAEFMHKNHRSLHGILRLVGGETEHLGGAFLNAFRGPVGPILALVGLFQLVKSKLDEDSKALDDLAAAAAEPMGEGIMGITKAFDAGKLSLGQFLAAMKAAGEDNDPIKTQIERAKELVIAKLEGEKKILEAQGRTAEAQRLDEQIRLTKGSSGLITEQDERAAAAPGLQQKAETANAAANEARRQFNESQAELNKLREQNGQGEGGKTNSTAITETQTLAELDKKLEAYRAQNEGAKYYGNGSVETSSRMAIEQLEEERRKITDRQESRRQRISQLEGSEAGRAQTVAEAEAAAAAAKNAATTNQGRIRQLPSEIDQAGKMEGIAEHTDRVKEILATSSNKLHMSLNELLTATNKTDTQRDNILAQLVADKLKMQTVLAQLEAQLARTKSNTDLH